MIKQNKKNELKEKRSNRHPIYFEKLLEDLDKILEIKVEPMNAIAFEEDKKKNITKNLRLTYLSKDEKEAPADLKNDACEGYLKNIKEEKTIVEFNVNPNEDECLKTKDLEGLKNNQ
ncbi:hypothetical protein F8M41_015440 [Gigaspora margarita]|uniref:Uncharacterized protein n=1 Tax=Gigaspora margarita TaxID=4874 RepID=A0A8H4AQQ1_GIGMA|nr:hypothetical protein F8M41_015440 [Gigaspora margarita]